MSRVIADMSMSLDGFVADPRDGVEDLFGWYANGSVETPPPTPASRFGHRQPAHTGSTTPTTSVLGTAPPKENHHV